MTTEVKTPDFDDLLAAYDIPDIAEKSSSSLTPEVSTSNHSNSIHGDNKEKIKVVEKVELIKLKIGMESAKDGNEVETEDEDRLVIDEKQDDEREKHDGVIDKMKKQTPVVDVVDDEKRRGEDGTKEKNGAVDDKMSKDSSNAENKGSTDADKNKPVIDNIPATEGADILSLTKKSADAERCQKLAAEQLKQLSENVIKDKEKGNNSVVIINKPMPTNKLASIAPIVSSPKLSLTDTPPLASKPQVKIAPKPVVTTKVTASQILTITPTTNTISGATTPQRLVVVTSSPAVLTNAVNIAPAKITNVGNVTNSNLPNVINIAPAKFGNTANVAQPKLGTLSIGQSKLTIPASTVGRLAPAIPLTTVQNSPTATVMGPMTTGVPLNIVQKPTIATTMGPVSTAVPINKAQAQKSSIIDALENSGPTVNVVVTNNLLKRFNPVPRYSPIMPPREWDLKIPEGGYKCLECSDSFVLDSSLSMHLERRSMMIVYVCEICNKKLVFYNKCSLLRHIRLHYSKSAKNITVSLKSVDVSPLSKNITSLWPSRDRLGLPVNYQDVDPSTVSKNQASCSECHVVFANSNSKKAHLQLNVKSNESFSCYICGLQCPNKCYFEAHQRIHRNQSPYVCPECGEEKYDRELFYIHLNSTCIHFCRQAVYKCPQCNAGYPNIAHLKSHLQNSHTDSFCKCPVCPMAFKSIENINNHMLTQHKITDHGFRVIHKCPMCDTVFTQKNNVPPHLDTHLLNKDNLRIDVFKCNECYKHYDSKEALEKHQLSVHKGVQLKDFICDVCRTPFKTYQFMLQHKAKHFEPKPITQPTVPRPIVSKQDNQKSEVFKCMYCPMKFSNAQLLKDHTQTHKKPNPGASLPKHKCPDCNAVFSKREELSKHMKHTHGKVASYPCHLCRRSFESNKSLQRHLRLKHKLSHMYTCWHCIDKKKTFSKRSLLEHHLKITHGITMAMDDPMQGRRDANLSISSLVSRKRKSSFPREGEKRAKFEFMSHYKCGKCSFDSADRKVFQNHIVEHKTEPALAQCKECGMCFRGDQSLKKHLYMMHKIKDVHGYEMAVQAFEEKGIVSGGSSGSQSSDNTGVSTAETNLECNVCYRTFDSEVTLRTHMRNHGMAFIRSKRHNSVDA